MNQNQNKQIEINLNIDVNQIKNNSLFFLKKSKKNLLILFFCFSISFLLVFLLEHTIKINFFEETTSEKFLSNSNQKNQISFADTKSFFGNIVNGTLGYHMLKKECSKEKVYYLIKKGEPVFIYDFNKENAHYKGITNSYSSWELPTIPAAENHFYSDLTIEEYDKKLNFWYKKGVLKPIENSYYLQYEKEMLLFDVDENFNKIEPSDVNEKGFKISKIDNDYYVWAEYKQFKELKQNFGYYEFVNPMTIDEFYLYKNKIIIILKAFKKDFIYSLIIGIQLYIYIKILLHLKINSLFKKESLV